MKRLALAILLFLPVSSIGAEDEVSLYDSEGEAVAYIDLSDELTIYLWSGTPVAYIEDQHVYGFNGSHLGWFCKGAIIDHDGDAPCVVKGRHPSPKFESFKSFKKFKSFKSFRSFAPFKPFESGKFSGFPCSIFLAQGAK